MNEKETADEAVEETVDKTRVEDVNQAGDTADEAVQQAGKVAAAPEEAAAEPTRNLATVRRDQALPPKAAPPAAEAVPEPAAEPEADPAEPTRNLATVRRGQALPTKPVPPVAEHVAQPADKGTAQHEAKPEAKHEVEPAEDPAERTRNLATVRRDQALTAAPVPQAPVPQAPVPQAPVPQAPVPQAPVPQAPVPQARVPQAAEPDAVSEKETVKVPVAEPVAKPVDETAEVAEHEAVETAPETKMATVPPDEAAEVAVTKGRMPLEQWRAVALGYGDEPSGAGAGSGSGGQPPLDTSGGRRRGALAMRLGVPAAALAGYLLLAVFQSGSVPAGTVVGGVPIGGQSREVALATLHEKLASQETDPVTLQSGSKTTQLKPADAGLALDLPGTLDGLTGFSLSPVSVWSHLFGGGDHKVDTSVDSEKLTSAVQGLSTQVGSSAREGSISLAGGKVALVEPRAGTTLDVTRTVDSIAKAWPTTQPIPVTLASKEPAVPAAEFQRVKTEFADKAMSGPITVKVGDKSFKVTAASLAPAISFKAEGATLAPAFDNAKLTAAVRKAALHAGVERPAEDAKVEYANGSPSVTPSVAGVKLVVDKLPSVVIPALTSERRTVSLTTTPVAPNLTTAQAKATLPKGLISTFTTNFPFNPPRTNNIRIAAATLNGTYIAPGAQFSLNGTLGERTPEKGYAEAPVINDGRLEKDYGGGVSQVSTTTFNAAFFAGVQFDEYTPHSFYISRYPEGREATVSWPDVDQKWTNTTGGGILIKTSVGSSSITVSFFGTKTWDIEAQKGPRRNVVQPKEIIDDTEGCVTQSPTPGFDVTVTRIFRKNGSTVKTQNFNTHYIPEDKVTCTNPTAN